MNASSNPQITGAARILGQTTVVAAASVLIGAALGLFTARWSRVADSTRIAAAKAPLPADSMMGAGQVIPERLEYLADMQAQPLLAQLKSTPDDPQLLAKLGSIYYMAHNFKEASTYFKRSVDRKDDVVVRTELGRAYYYAGDPDSALAEFENVLKSDPNNANALFNVGMVKWQSKSDAEGAVAAWRQLLLKYPNHPRKAEVEQLMVRAKQH